MDVETVDFWCVCVSVCLMVFTDVLVLCLCKLTENVWLKVLMLHYYLRLPPVIYF